MKVLMFKPQFAELVRSGKKNQTIRPVRKVPVKPGDSLSLRRWLDLPYRSKQEVLREARCTSVSTIRIEATGIVIGRECKFTTYNTMGALDEQARLDGFADFPDMAAWFERVHGLPFNGVLIVWA